MEHRCDNGHAQLESRRRWTAFALVVGMWAASAAGEAAGAPNWPQEPTAPADAPNVLIWLMDDVGFGQIGPFGGLIGTPTLDALAAQGVRFTDFHATPLCSPTRASLLSGRNPHAVAVGAHANTPAGYPGYHVRIPKSAAGVGRILRDRGYATYAVGKWDQLPAEHTSAAGPFDYWPSGQGFQHFYGFLHYDAHHFRPHLWRGHAPVADPAADNPDYHLTTDLADQAIRWIRNQRAVRPGQPFLMYWSTGAVHAPHHAPRAYIDRYRGQFDQGWHVACERILARQKRLGVVPADTELPPWPAELPRWESLARDERRMAARAMEAFAGMLEHADVQFGRIIDVLRSAGALENTIVIVLSDNGASAEGGLAGSFNELLMGQVGWQENLAHFERWGGPETYPHYPVGWAAAGNTPFRYYKQSAFEGGNRVPMIISWPRGTESAGGLRSQYHHVSDIVPTILELTGIKPPREVAGVAQRPMDGVSIAYALADAEAPGHKRIQYYELWGNHGIWADGWKANVQLRPIPWDVYSRLSVEEAPWELYHVAADINEQINLASQRPEKLAEMQRLFDVEARRNNVYPLAPDFQAEARTRLLATLGARDGVFAYRPPVTRVPMPLAPPLNQFPFRLTARIDDGGAIQDGVIMAMGGQDGGFALLVQNHRPVFGHNRQGREVRYVRGNDPLPSGPLEISVDVDWLPQAPGAAVATLSVAGEAVATVDLVGVNAALPGHESLGVSADEGSAVVPGSGRFRPLPQGVIQEVRFELDVDR